MSKYDAVFTCGSCKKEIKLSDKVFVDIVMGFESVGSFCHLNFNSKIRARMSFKMNGKRWCYGRAV